MIIRIPPVVLGAHLFKEGVVKENGKCAEEPHNALGITAVKMYVIIITRGTWMLTLGTARLQRRQVVGKKVS